MGDSNINANLIDKTEKYKTNYQKIHFYPYKSVDKILGRQKHALSLPSYKTVK